MVSVLVMLNNYLHDFAVAILFSILLVMYWIYKQSAKESFQSQKQFAALVFNFLNKVLIYVWVFILFGGIIRTLTYKDFEWSESAGRNQVPALILKHILLAGFVIAGSIMQFKLYKFFKKEK